MGGIATPAGTSIDDVTGSIGIPMATTIGLIPLADSLFDVTPVMSAPAGRGPQRRIASAAGDRPATNHTSLAHSTSLLTNADRGPKMSADTPQHITRASDSMPISNTVHTLTRGCY
jgi:hypothetical protein